MSRGWTPPLAACALAALAWNCAGGPQAPASAPTPVAAPKPAAPATEATPTATTAASAMRSTQSGVYTDEQAAKGKDVYGLQCLSCHSGDHIGAPFRRHWAGKPLANLYGLMVETMPQDNPGSLPQDDYVRVIAYLLKANGMPAGETPLPSDSLALAKIRLDTVSTKR